MLLRVPARQLAAAFFLAASTLTLGAGTAGAAGLTIAPVRMDLPAGRKGDSFSVTNAGTQRKTIEVEVLKWSQRDGEDRYAPTQELLVNPPLFILQGGATQVVRVGRPSGAAAPAVDEKAYRIYFREVPGAQDAQGMRLSFALRVGIPVFVLPEKPARAALTWSAWRQPDGALKIRVSNGGRAHERLSEIALRGGGAGAVPLDGFKYVLPGAWQEWDVPPSMTAAGAVRLSARAESGALELDLVPRPE